MIHNLRRFSSKKRKLKSTSFWVHNNINRFGFLIWLEKIPRMFKAHTKSYNLNFVAGRFGTPLLGFEMYIFVGLKKIDWSMFWSLSQTLGITRQSKQCGFSIYIFDNSKSKLMVRLVRAEKMVWSGLVFARKIARMILIQNI